MFEPEHPDPGLPKLWTRVRGWISTLGYKYADLISDDLEWTSKMEGVVRVVSYMMTLGKSEFISELVYSFSNIMVLFNDTILLSVLRRKSNQPLLKKIIFRSLIILETFQASIEMFTKRYLGEKCKWVAITLVSLLKSLSRALLVFYLCTGISHCQATQPIDRQLLKGSHPVEGEDGEEAVVTSAGRAWVGSRTNKVIRSVQDDNNRPYEELRDTHIQLQNIMEQDEVPWSILSTTQLIGEGIYIAKPIVHLLSMATFGEKSLKSWLVPLSMELISLYLMEKEGNALRPPELQELSKRRFNFVYYIMRSPVYDNYFKTRLLSILGYLANRIPLFGRIIEQFILYLPTWQATYFYVWAN